MDWQNQSFYTYAVTIYLIPNVLAALLFVLPPLRRTMERSNWRIVTLIMWWAQASISSTFTSDSSVCVHVRVFGLVDILVFVSFSST
jgi:callose synthase